MLVLSRKGTSLSISLLRRMHKFAEKNSAVVQLTTENERLKKENLELIGTVESLKKVVKSVWTHLSDYYRDVCESLGIRQSRGYHR